MMSVQFLACGATYDGMATYAKWNDGGTMERLVVLGWLSFREALLNNVGKFGLYRPCPWRHDLDRGYRECQMLSFLSSGEADLLLQPR